MSVPNSIGAAMRATNDVFCKSVVQLRDMEALDRVYTADAQILPPGAELIQGLSGIKSFWSQAIKGLDVKAATLATVSADKCGDGVLEIGRAELTLGNDQVVPLKYLVHWKNESEAWKWHVDIWNMNQ